MARRLSPSVPVDVGLLGVTVFLLVVVALGSAHLRPYNTPELDLRPVLLPVYLLLSLTRMVLAYTIAVLLALAVGNLAARSRMARYVEEL